MNEKLLILEANWAEDDGDYLLDSRSASQVYGSLERLLANDDYPLTIIQRPLLKCRFKKDVEQFVNLESNKKGLNVILLSAHGALERDDCRELDAIDGRIDVSAEMKKLKPVLHRSIIILDSCGVGENIKSFLAASGALGVIGFSKTVDWVDSAVFVLALLCRLRAEGVFSMKKSAIRPRKVMEALEQSHYSQFFEVLGVEYEFVNQ